MLKLLLIFYLISCIIYYIGIQAFVYCLNDEEFREMALDVLANDGYNEEDVQYAVRSSAPMLIPIFNFVVGFSYIRHYLPTAIMLKMTKGEM